MSHRSTDVLCSCGGRITIRDWDGRASRQFRYEASCSKCGICDPNGWSSKKRCIEEAKTYFGGNQALEAIASNAKEKTP